MSRTPLLPLFAVAIGANEKSIGIMYAAASVSSIITKFATGFLSDIIGKRFFLLLGLAIGAISSYLYSFTTNIRAIVGIRYFHGLSTGCYTPSSMAIVANVAGKRKGTLFSLISIVKTGTKSLGAFIATCLISYLAMTKGNVAGYQRVFLIAGAIGILGFLIAFLLLKDVGEKEAAKGGDFQQLGQNIRDTITNFPLLMTSIIGCIKNIGTRTMEVFLVIYAIKEAGLTNVEGSSLWIALTGVSIFTKPIMGMISDRFGRKFIITFGIIFCGISLGLIPVTHNFSLLLLLCLLFGIGEAFAVSSIAALVAEVSNTKNYGGAMGFFYTINDIGDIIGPLIGGALIMEIGYFKTFGIFGAIMCLCAGAFVIFVHPKNNLT